MHEFSLLADLMKKIDEVAKKENAEKVVSLKVWIGALAHISADHFREHFEHAAKDTIAQARQWPSLRRCVDPGREPSCGHS